MSGDERFDVRRQVEEAIGGEWASFELRHPHLAAALDQDLLTVQAIEALADDPEYQEALAQAEAMGVGIDAIGALVTKLVRRWLGGILG